MKPNQRGRFNGRHNNSSRGSRPQIIYRNTALESTGPCGKLRGTALQLHEKYMMAAKDAQIQNDDILAETCCQYADHYMHVQNQAILNEQALHAQQQVNRQQNVVDENVSESDKNSLSESAVQEVKSEDDIKVIDLSVPVADMNQKAVLEDKTFEKKQKVQRARTIKTAVSKKTSEEKAE